MMTREQAKTLIEEVALRFPGAVRLACLASLAARVEPELLRAIRVEIARDLDAGAEADLWFSPLVGGRSSSWMLFFPEVAEMLRERCMTEFAAEQLARTRALILNAHAKASPLVQLEDELHWLSLFGSIVPLEEKLYSIVHALRAPDSAGVARWAARTIPRLSSHVRDLPAAWLARLIAVQELGQPMPIDPNGATVPAEMQSLLRGAMPMSELWARVVPGGIELAREAIVGGQRFPAPLTEPMTVEVMIEEGARAIAVPREAVMFVPLPEISLITLRTIDGATHHVLLQGTSPHSTVSFRWLLMADTAHVESLELQADIMNRAVGPIHAIFLVGDLEMKHRKRPRGAAPFGPPLPERLQEFPHLGEPFVFFCSEDMNEWESTVGHLTDSVRKPVRFRRGAKASDFAATIEHVGTLLGVVGLVWPWTESEIREACGMEVDVWTAAHHTTILLTSGKVPLKEIEKIAPHFKMHFFDRYPQAALVPIGAGSLDPEHPDAGFVQGELRIGSDVQIEAQGVTLYAPKPDRQIANVPITKPRFPRQTARPEKWVLVAGTDSPESQYAIDVARELGAALAAAGYGLATGGWPGIDEEVTKGYAAALLASPTALQNTIRHHVGGVKPGASIPGRRLFASTDEEAVETSVAAASAVVLIEGGGGTRWVGEAAHFQNKPLVPIAATGGAAAEMREFAPRQWGLENKDRSPRQHAENAVKAITELLIRPPDDDSIRTESGKYVKGRARPKKK